MIEVPSNWMTLRRINGRIHRVKGGKLKVSLGPGEGAVLILDGYGIPDDSPITPQGLLSHP